MRGGQVQMLPKQKVFSRGMAGGSVALAIVCVAALQGAAGEPHANDGPFILVTDEWAPSSVCLLSTYTRFKFCSCDQISAV